MVEGQRNLRPDGTFEVIEMDAGSVHFIGQPQPLASGCTSAEDFNRNGFWLATDNPDGDTPRSSSSKESRSATSNSCCGDFCMLAVSAVGSQLRVPAYGLMHSRGPRWSPDLGFLCVGHEGLEPPTSSMSWRRSSQLS